MVKISSGVFELVNVIDTDIQMKLSLNRIHCLLMYNNKHKVDFIRISVYYSVKSILSVDYKGLHIIP